MILSYSFSIRVEAELAIRSETRRCANFCMDCQLTEPQLCRQENWKPKTESWKAQISWCFLKSSVTYLPTLFDWQFRCIKSLRIRIPICTKWLHFECMEMYGHVCCLSFELFGSWGLDFLGHLQSQLLWGKQTTSPQWSFCTASGSLAAGDWPLGSEGNWASRARQMES